MKKKILLFITVFLFLASIATEIYGQSNQARIRQLNDELTNGNVTLSAKGNGSSSGNSVLGTLRNNTQNRIRINVTLSGGVYLSNSGTGQNMIATQIYLSDGSYYSEGGSLLKFIELLPNVNTQISFNAYCADFERDNPSDKETFSNIAMPSGLQSISLKISRYENDHFDDDLTIPIQVALWRSQGENRTTILKKFRFTDADWEIATKILNY
jgi:hypothetical protein